MDAIQENTLQVAQTVNAITSVRGVYCSTVTSKLTHLFQFSWSGCMHAKGSLSEGIHFEVSDLAIALHLIKHESDVDEAAPPTVRNLLDDEAEVARYQEKKRKRKAGDGKMRLMTLVCIT
jgi:hypothetical protein